jgi:hypothetical protein
MKNHLLKNGLVVCAMLFAVANTVPTMAEDISEVAVVATSNDIASNGNGNSNSESQTNTHDDFDSEVALIVDEVIGELKAEWKDLDQEERQEVKDALRSLREGINITIPDSFSFGGLSSVIVPIFAILFTFGSPVLVIGLLLLFSYRKRRQRDALVAKFIDAGKDVPPEVLATFNDNAVSGNNLQRGLILSGIGSGLFLFLGMLVGWGVASVALIPLCIGIARLLIWKLSEQQAEIEPRNNNTAV